jgi:predicted RNase H-like nuclease
LRFIGCALAWRPGESREKTSCLVAMDERGNIVANSFASGVEEISASVEGYAADRRGVILGIDAPLSVPNERGTRRIERILSKLSLPAYSASRKMFGGEPYPEELLEALQKSGIEYTDYPFSRVRRQSVAVEVDSGATLKILSLERAREERNGDIARKLRDMTDPKFRKGNKEERASALKGAVDVLWNAPGLRMRTGNLSSDLASAENVDISKLDIDSKLSHAELDRVSSLVEATLAAYTVHRHWKGRGGSIVLGSGYEGAVLLPATETLHARIAEECRNAGVPYV